MAFAFAQFDEPHAWLIRGLVDYGWVDVSRSGGHIPQGVFGGLNLSETAESEGREGIVLEVPAISAGQVCKEDGTYLFQVKVSRTEAGELALYVRCPEANYFQEFPFDSDNPTWAAGYIHQALTEYVPQFVSWRLSGGEVTWAQRAGIPDVEGEPCSFLLSNFLRERVNTNRPIHAGLTEGWWLPGTEPVAEPTGDEHETPVATADPWTGAVAVEGKGGGEPIYMSEAAAAAGVQNAAEVANVQARAVTAGPGTTLLTVSVLTMVEGVLLLANAVVTLIWYTDNVLAVAVSLLGAMVVLMGGFVSILGALRYRKAEGGPLPWFTMIYISLVPGCCLAGLPVAVWAAMVWNKPMVKAARG